MNKEIELLKKMITVVDSYRINLFLSVKHIDNEIGQVKLKSEVKKEWKRVREKMVKMANASLNIPLLKKIAKIRETLRFITWSIVFLAFVTFILTMIVGAGDFSIIWITASIVLLILMILEPIFNYAIAKNVEKYYLENVQRFEQTKDQLKSFAQQLIFTLKEEMRKARESSENNPIKIYNIDYQRIKVKKNPALWRRHYIITIS
jgi:diacylglycerol kinase